jgi:2-furoyl-CoA dehydrogenase large subunit
VVFADRALHSSVKPDKRLPFGRVCGTFHWSPALITAALGDTAQVALRETVFWTHDALGAPDRHDHVNTSLAYGFVLDACGVEIDPLTCAVRIDRYITAHDAGVILHPQGADGQVYGGFAQGVGAATLEEFAYGEDGSFLSGTFADYRVPTAHEVPVPLILHHETPSPFTPLGAKGIGEGNNMSTPVCIANAIADAMGIEDVVLPATPPRVHALLVQKGLVTAVAARSSSGSGAPSAGRTGKPSPLHASGSVTLPATPEEIFAVLLDPQRLRKVIPGCESIATTRSGADAREYNCIATVRIGVAKARFSASISLAEIKHPSSVVLSGEGRGSLGTAGGSGQIQLAADGAHGTTLTYDYGAHVSGKLAAVGARLLEGATRLVLAQLFKALGREARGDVPRRLSFLRRLLERVRGRR